MKVGFIGAGNMASAMIGGIINSKLLSPSNIIASAKTDKTLANIKEKYKINTTKDSISLVKECDIVVIAVKPNVYEEVLKQIKDYIDNEKIIVTIAAGISINSVEKIIGNDKVKELELIETKLIQKDSETRLVPVNIENSNYLLDMDYVVMAIGSAPEEEVMKKFGLERTKKGYIKVDEEYRTSNEKIFAGGDIIGQKGTVAFAAKSGRDAAESIIKYLKN